MSDRPSRAAEAESSDTRRRILQQAREYFFAHGYSGFTMDELAAELGMSKKTLYVYFAGKDELIGGVIQDLSAEVRAEAETILSDHQLNFAEKLRRFVESMVARLSRLQPRTLRDLQRYAPPLYARIDEMRRKNVPYIFGRFINEGQAAGLVRSDAPTDFAIEFFLHGVQGLLQAPTLARLNLPPREIVARAIDLFFGGLLTPSGRKQYEKLFPR